MLGIPGVPVGGIRQKPGSPWPMTGASLGRWELCASIQGEHQPPGIKLVPGGGARLRRPAAGRRLSWFGPQELRGSGVIFFNQVGPFYVAASGSLLHVHSQPPFQVTMEAILRTNNLIETWPASIMRPTCPQIFYQGPKTLLKIQ
jgi:hypothetical protein